MAQSSVTLRDDVPVDAVDADVTDPALLREHSQFKSYKTSHFEYPEIRVFYRQHAKAEELYKSHGPLPLLVCIPGLGGSIAQFHPLLSSLVDMAPCLAIDHPGGGRSKFAPTSWDAYSPEALAELYEVIIDDYRDKEAEQTVVLIGHSMGTARAAMLANKKLPHVTDLADYIVGLVAICPVAEPPNEKLTNLARWALWIPGWLFDLWRMWDGIGGPESPSVARFVGPEAEAELKVLQYRFNKQSRTSVWRRMVYGALPLYKDGKPHGGNPGLDVWAGLDLPVFLIAGENDKITPPEEAEKIAKALRDAWADMDDTENGQVVADAAAPINASADVKDHIPQSIGDLREEDFQKSKTAKTIAMDGESHDDAHDDDPSTPHESPAAIPTETRHPKKVVETIVIPAPATHALLYTPRCVRGLAGLISDFLSNHVTGRLSLGWQLQYLSREGKWDVKNLNKWKSVKPVGDPIGPADKPIFRPMKTLREADDVHCPKEFVAKWSHIIKDVVDISKDQPVYDPRGLERAGVQYHKFPTVSKVPPTGEEVSSFIQLIDEIRERRKAAGDDSLIGVHCHYGFNRTGYFIVCYLVERCGFGVKEATEAFAAARPNGIRHSHFLDRLYVRYNIDTAQRGG
jgi:pimeloyl-ACP methyl ester carboxylesterase/protein-tyrosine phosphatase